MFTALDDFDSAKVSVLVSLENKYSFEKQLNSDNFSLTVFNREFYVFGFSFTYDANFPGTITYTLDLRNHYTKWLDLPVSNSRFLAQNLKGEEDNESCLPPNLQNFARGAINVHINAGVYSNIATENEIGISINTFLDKLRSYYSITSVDFTVSGFSEALIYISKDRLGVTTLSDCLTQLRGYGLYVTFLGLEMVIQDDIDNGEYIPWHILNSSFSETTLVFPRIVPPIAIEYKQQIEEIDEETPPPQSPLTFTRPTFKAIPTISSKSVSGDPSPEECPGDIKDLYTLDLNFDVSGVKKVKIEGEYKNNLPIKEIVTTYGFKYLAKEISVLTGRNGWGFNKRAKPFWGIVEQKIIIYNYDLPKYYYLGSTVKGFRFTRFQVEDETNPISFDYDYTQLGDSPTAEDLAYANFQLSLVEFVSTPLLGEEKVILIPFDRVYTDLPYKSPFIYYESCNLAGEVVLKPIINLNYALPRFQIAKTTYESCYRFLTNPENLVIEVVEGERQLEAPDFTTGKEIEITEYLQVFKTQNTTNQLVYGTKSILNNATINIIHNPNFNEINVSEDKYITYTKTTSTQEGSFKNYVSSITSSVSTGRPSPVPYIELFRREDLAIKPPDQRDNIIIGDTPNITLFPLIVASDHFSSKINYLTPNSSINIRLRASRSVIFDRAKKLLTKQELSSSNTATFEIPLDVSLRVGTSFSCVIGGLSAQIKGTIVSTSHSISIVNNIPTGITTITVNKDVYQGKSLTTNYIKNTFNPGGAFNGVGGVGGAGENNGNTDNLGQLRSTIYINRGNRL